MAEPHGDRFAYHGGKFYGLIGTISVDGGTGGPPVYGVWEMRGAGSRDVIPAAAQQVTIHPPGADAPGTEPGETLGQRAVAAELDAAHQRAQAAQTAGRLAQASADLERTRRRLDVERTEWRDGSERHRGTLLELAVLAGLAYGRTHEIERLTSRDDPPQAGALAALIRRILSSTHPSVDRAVPGPAMLAEAQVVARTELASRTGTLEGAIEKALLAVLGPSAVAPCDRCGCRERGKRIGAYGENSPQVFTCPGCGQHRTAGSGIEVAG